MSVVELVGVGNYATRTPAQIRLDVLAGRCSRVTRWHDLASPPTYSGEGLTMRKLDAMSFRELTARYLWRCPHNPNRCSCKPRLLGKAVTQQDRAMQNQSRQAARRKLVR